MILNDDVNFFSMFVEQKKEENIVGARFKFSSTLYMYNSYTFIP